MSIFFVFYFMKMLRSFSLSEVEGGIWNYIQLFFVLIGVILFLINFRYFILNPAILSLFIYTFAALANSWFSFELARADIYNYTMIAYPFCVLIIACEISRYTDISRCHLIPIIFYAISAVFIFKMLSKGEYSTRTGAVADVYYVIGLIPLMMIYSKKFKLIPLMVAGTAVIISGKRTGIICYFIMIILYYLIMVIETRELLSSVSEIIKLAIVLALFAVALYYINGVFNGNLLDRLSRAIEEQDSSGRTERWNQIVTELERTDLIHLTFGHGMGAVAKDFGGKAHNDVLEIIYNYGVFPLLAYLSFTLFAVRELFMMIRRTYEYAAQYAMVIVFTISIAMFSYYVVDASYVTSGMLSLGCILVDFRKKHFMSDPLSKLI